MTDKVVTVRSPTSPFDSRRWHHHMLLVMMMQIVRSSLISFAFIATLLSVIRFQMRKWKLFLLLTFVFQNLLYAKGNAECWRFTHFCYCRIKLWTCGTTEPSTTLSCSHWSLCIGRSLTFSFSLPSLRCKSFFDCHFCKVSSFVSALTASFCTIFFFFLVPRGITPDRAVQSTSTVNEIRDSSVD